MTLLVEATIIYMIVKHLDFSLVNVKVQYVLTVVDPTLRFFQPFFKWIHYAESTSDFT